MKKLHMMPLVTCHYFDDEGTANGMYKHPFRTRRALSLSSYIRRHKLGEIMKDSAQPWRTNTKIARMRPRDGASVVSYPAQRSSAGAKSEADISHVLSASINSAVPTTETISVIMWSFVVN